MSNTIYDTDFSKYLPEALQKDPKMLALAKAATDQLLQASGLIDNVLLYSRIDELPEELVDILAYDMHVDWYDYNYPLEVKRDLVKNSVRVHKKMGTKHSIEIALGSLFPESEVEEWWEYEGQPGHFQVILDVTNQKIVADYEAIIRAVKLYKRLSAHMDELTYQGQVHAQIITHGEYFKYTVPMANTLKAGTHPQRNRRGAVGRETVIVGTEAAGFIFNAPQAGTKPYRNVLFANQTTHIDAETALNEFGYTNTPAGRKRAGEAPQRSTRGGTSGAAVEAEDNGAAFIYTSPAAGTVPDRNTVHKTNGSAVEQSVQAMGFSYTAKPCGSTRKL